MRAELCQGGAVGDQDHLGEKGHARGSAELSEGADMRTAYDFSKMKGRRNPYARLLKKPVTIRLGADVGSAWLSTDEVSSSLKMRRKAMGS